MDVHQTIDREQLNFANGQVVKAMVQGLYGELMFKFEDGVIVRCFYKETSLPPKSKKKSKKDIDDP